MGIGPGSGAVGWCYVCVRCETGFSVRWQVQVSVYCAWRIPAHLRCTSEMHPVFNPVAPYGYLLSDMYLFMADITNPDTLV